MGAILYCLSKELKNHSASSIRSTISMFERRHLVFGIILYGLPKWTRSRSSVTRGRRTLNKLSRWKFIDTMKSADVPQERRCHHAVVDIGDLGWINYTGRWAGWVRFGFGAFFLRFNSCISAAQQLISSQVLIGSSVSMIDDGAKSEEGFCRFVGPSIS